MSNRHENFEKNKDVGGLFLFSLGVGTVCSLHFSYSYSSSLCYSVVVSMGVLWTMARSILYFEVHGTYLSHLQYGLITWSSTFKTYLKKVSILQNKAVKIVGGGNYCDRATPFYSKLRILKLVDMVFLEKAIFMFKFKMKMLPDQFSYYFMKTCQVYQKFTRASNHNNYFIPHSKSSETQRSIKYQGPLVWNSLDTSLKNCKTSNYFKAELKKLLLNKYT